MVKVYEHEVELLEIVTETPETKTFRFDLKGKDFPFRPGQFVMLTAEIPGRGSVARPLSIASSPLETGIMDLTVKKFPDGVMSSFLCDHAKIGDIYKIKGPYGVFTLDESAKHLVFIAAGSGIAPFRSMWRYISEKGLDIDVTLIFSSKTHDYIIFRKELENLNNNGNVKVVHTLTRNTDPKWKGYARRIDKGMLEEVIHDFGNNLFYACGPPHMCESARQALLDLSVPAERIKMEKYD